MQYIVRVGMKMIEQNYVDRIIQRRKYDLYKKTKHLLKTNITDKSQILQKDMHTYKHMNFPIKKKTPTTKKKKPCEISAA